MLLCGFWIKEGHPMSNHERTVISQKEENTLEYMHHEFGVPFPAGNYVFDNGFTISIERKGGHKRSRTGGPYRSWVDVKVNYKGKTHAFRLHRDQETDSSPIEYDAAIWKGFVIKRLADNDFVVLVED
jgi:hypothetical protein